MDGNNERNFSVFSVFSVFIFGRMYEAGFWNSDSSCFWEFLLPFKGLRVNVKGDGSSYLKLHNS